MPEVLLFVFLAAMVPLVVMVGALVVRKARLVLTQPAAFVADLSANRWPLAAALLCLVGSVVAVIVFWRNWTYLWAVARRLIIEALHRKVVIVLLVFFAVLMLSLPFILKTEGSLKSQTQLTLFYALVLGLTLLSVLAIFVSAASICSEVEQKHIQVTDTKPLKRWQFLLGKWFGVVVMCSTILSIMAFAAAALTMQLVKKPDTRRMLKREAEAAMANYNQVFDEVLVARRPVIPELPEQAFTRAEEIWKEIVAKGDAGDNVHKRERHKRRVLDATLAEYYTVMAGHAIVMRVDGLLPGQEGSLFVRWDAHSSKPGEELSGTWVVLRRDVVEDEKGKTGFRYVPVHVELPPAAGYEWTAYARNEFEMPASVVPPDGTLFFQYENINTASAAMFNHTIPIEILQKQGGFWPNYYRALLTLLCHVALLAALGMMAGAVFSFPVATLTVVFVVVVGLIGPWFGTLLEPAIMTGEAPFLRDLLETIWRRGVEGFLTVMPHFGKYNPLSDLTDGITVTWSSVALAGAVMVFLQGTVAMLIGIYFYTRRELARVIV